MKFKQIVFKKFFKSDCKDFEKGAIIDVAPYTMGKDRRSFTCAKSLECDNFVSYKCYLMLHRMENIKS